MGAILGIDPGKTGAIARLFPEEAGVEVAAISIIIGARRKEYDIGGILWAIRTTGEIRHVFIEKQQPLPPKMGGGIANFSRGYGLALFEGILSAHGIPYTLVHPKTWQAVMLEGTPGTDTKQRSILAAQRLFPGVDLRRTPRSKKPDDGFADALLIAAYGRRRL